MRVKDRTLALETPPPLHNVDIKGAALSQLKTLMRHSSVALDDCVREYLWLELSSRHSSPDTQFDGLFDSSLETNKLPRFVEPRVARFFALDPSGRQEVTSVLWHISQGEFPLAQSQQ